MSTNGDELPRPSARLRAARAALLDDNASALLARVRDVFCEPTRSQIVRALSTGPLSVNEVAAVVRRSKWATSQHLRVLRQDGVVVAKRRGRSVYYRLAPGDASASALGALELVANSAA